MRRPNAITTLLVVFFQKHSRSSTPGMAKETRRWNRANLLVRECCCRVDWDNSQHAESQLAFVVPSWYGLWWRINERPRSLSRCQAAPAYSTDAPRLRSPSLPCLLRFVPSLHWSSVTNLNPSRQSQGKSGGRVYFSKHFQFHIQSCTCNPNIPLQVQITHRGH